MYRKTLFYKMYNILNAVAWKLKMQYCSCTSTLYFLDFLAWEKPKPDEGGRSEFVFVFFYQIFVLFLFTGEGGKKM